MQCSFFSEGAVERRVRTAGTATLIAAAATTLLLALGAAAAEGSIAIELNKLEPQGKTCRAYIVI